MLRRVCRVTHSERCHVDSGSIKFRVTSLFFLRPLSN